MKKTKFFAKNNRFYKRHEYLRVFLYLVNFLLILGFCLRKRFSLTHKWRLQFTTTALYVEGRNAFGHLLLLVNLKCGVIKAFRLQLFCRQHFLLFNQSFFLSYLFTTTNFGSSGHLYYDDH